MIKVVSKWLIILVVSLIPLTSVAFGDDDQKGGKKIIVIKPEIKKPGKGSKTNKEDSITLEKSKEDTLTFDDKLEKDDTLIFADDEVNLNGPEESGSDRTDFSGGIGFRNITPSVYPNPSYGTTYITIPPSETNESEIIITSLNGTLVKSIRSTEKSYEINDLSPGTYFIQIKSNHQVVQKKLFVK